MPSQLLDTSFELGTGWMYNTSASRVTSAHDGSATLFPHIGTHFAQLLMYSLNSGCTVPVQGSIAQDFIVTPGNEGYYLVQFYTMWPELVWGFDIPDVFIDGVSLRDTIGVTVGGDPIHRWLVGEGNFGSGFYLALGAHSIEIRALGLIGDFDGSPAPCSAVKGIWFDNVSLVPTSSGIVLPGTVGPHLELIRLTHSGFPNVDKVRFSIPHGGVARLVHHS